jgi:hypothetical protein
MNYTIQVYGPDMPTGMYLTLSFYAASQTDMENYLNNIYPAAMGYTWTIV